jgi:hypothetical protein
MDQVAENGERAGVGAFERQRDGVAHPEAHAQMCRPDDFHGVTASSRPQVRELCKTKYTGPRGSSQITLRHKVNRGDAVRLGHHADLRGTEESDACFHQTWTC